jgi:hypothetical protein
MGKNTSGTILILAGMLVLVVSILLSSAYGGDDGFILKIVRAVWTGEIVFREGKTQVLPDRDEALYREFMEFKKTYRDAALLSDEEMIGKFYEAKYKGVIPRGLFNLKLEKKQVVTVQRKIALPNRFVFAACLFMMTAGFVLRVIAMRRKRRATNTAESSGLPE